MLEFCGAIALLLWGLHMMKTELTQTFAGRLRLWLAGSTRNRFMSFVAGCLVACISQSSTVTCLMVSSFVGTRHITTAMALATMLGADLGTSLVARAFALDLHWLSPALIVAGVFTFNTDKAGWPQAIGRIMIGLGLIMLALQLLHETTDPMEASVFFRSLISLLESSPGIALLGASLLTLISFSSLSVVLLTLSLAHAGLLRADITLACVLGANIGGALLPVIMTLKSPPLVRHAPVGNLLMRLSGSLILLPCLTSVGQIIASTTGNPASLAVDFHIAFNAMLAALFLPAVHPLAHLLDRLLPTKGKQQSGTDRLLAAQRSESADVALSVAAQEVLAMGEKLRTLLQESLHALTGKQAAPVADALALKDEMHRHLDALKQLMTVTAERHDFTSAQHRRSNQLLSYAIHLAHAGDITAVGLRHHALDKSHAGISFSAEDTRSIILLFDYTFTCLDRAQGVFIADDLKAARDLFTAKEYIRRLERLATEDHLSRLATELPFEKRAAHRHHALDTSRVHLAVLRDLKRVNAHLVAVATPILEREGTLKKSRLRTKVASQEA